MNEGEPKVRELMRNSFLHEVEEFQVPDEESAGEADGTVHEAFISPTLPTHATSRSNCGH